MIAVSYHDRVNVLQALRLAGPTPFDRPEWFELLAEEGGLQPMIALAQNSQQALALPLMRQGKTLVPFANWYNFIWRPLITENADTFRLLAAIARDLRNKEECVTFHSIPEEDGSAGLLASAFRSAGWVVFREVCDLNHVLPVEGRTYSEYLSGRPGSLRTTLKRKAKKIEVVIHTSFDEKAWLDYESVYSASWKPAEGKPAMLRRFAEQEGAAGRLRLGIATHQGRPIAAQFWTVESATAYIHKLAHIEEAAPLSAGTVLTAALFEHVLDKDRVTLVDFGTGDDPYKSIWMDTIRKRFRIECYNPRKPASWPSLIKACLRKLATIGSAG